MIVKKGDLVRDRRPYNAAQRRHYNHEDMYDEYCADEEGTLSPPAVFIKWHIVDGEEEGEFYSCARVLWPDRGEGNILRRDLEVISAIG